MRIVAVKLVNGSSQPEVMLDKWQLSIPAVNVYTSASAERKKQTSKETKILEKISPTQITGWTSRLTNFTNPVRFFYFESPTVPHRFLANCELQIFFFTCKN